MIERSFSTKCPKCHQRAVALASVSYTTPFHHDGRDYTVTIPDLVVPKCGNCGTIGLDEQANRWITEACYKAAGLLLPDEIRSQREASELTRSELAEELGVEESALDQWENGWMIQPRTIDRFLRLFFKMRRIRRTLLEEVGK
jgi:DNA-binding transcriptional regulator YiaG